eukprot:scaffold14925_cov97-Isochrysis_galbana.AAC.8
MHYCAPRHCSRHQPGGVAAASLRDQDRSSGCNLRCRMLSAMELHVSSASARAIKGKLWWCKSPLTVCGCSRIV